MTYACSEGSCNSLCWTGDRPCILVLQKRRPSHCTAVGAPWFFLIMSLRQMPPLQGGFPWTPTRYHSTSAPSQGQVLFPTALTCLTLSRLLTWLYLCHLTSVLAAPGKTSCVSCSPLCHHQLARYPVSCRHLTFSR